MNPTKLIFALLLAGLCGCDSNVNMFSPIEKPTPIDECVHVAGLWITPLNYQIEFGGNKVEQLQSCIKCGKHLKREFH